MDMYGEKMRGNKQVKKWITLWMVMFMIMLAFPVTGNAASKKAQVNKSVNTFFKYARNLNAKKLDTCFVEPLGFAKDKAFHKLIRPYSKKLTWKIKSTSVKGNKATVKVRADFESLNVSYWNAMLDSFNHAMKNQNTSLTKMSKRMMRVMSKEIAKNGSEPVYCTLKIKLQKVNGKWKISELSEELLNVMYCDYIYTIYEFFGQEW